MLVLQCVNFFYPSRGGTQLATYHLSKNLARLGVDVRIITFNVNPFDQLKNGYYSAGLPSYEEIDGLPVYRFPVIFLGRAGGTQSRYKIMISHSAVGKVLRENPDIIHFQGANQILQSVLTAHASILCRSKTLLTVHGLHAQIELFRNRTYSRLINELLLRLALRKVDRIIALSKSDLHMIDYLNIAKEKVSVIPNGIDLSRFRDLTQEKQLPKGDLDPDAPYVLCVTRIRENKGIESLIRAAANVVSKRPDVKFLLVGNCPKTYALKLRRLVSKVNLEKNFIFKGYVEHESDYLLSLYHHASVFVLPSFMESFPLVLLEAMAANLPIVASRVGGIPDLISSDEGILTAPGDVAALKSSLLFLLDNADIRKKLGQNAGRKAENYSWNKISRETLSVYERLLA